MKEIRQAGAAASIPRPRDGRSRSREGEEGKDFLIVSGRASASEPASSELDGCQISLQKGNKGKRMFEGRTMGEGREGKCRKDKNSPDDDPFFLQSLISVCQRVSGFGFGSLGLERKNGTTNGCCVSRGCLCSGPILIT